MKRIDSHHREYRTALKGAEASASMLFENLVDRVRLAVLLSVSPSYISKLMAEEGLPHYKIGRSTRYKLSEVMAFLKRRKRP